jgi:HupE / UreJ protein
MPGIVAFIFGLLHGFGFAGALSEVGLPKGHIPVALLFFNLGVEAGQLLFVAAVLAVVAGAKRFILTPEMLPGCGRSCANLCEARHRRQRDRSPLASNGEVLRPTVF